MLWYKNNSQGRRRLKLPLSIISKVPTVVMTTNLQAVKKHFQLLKCFSKTYFDNIYENMKVMYTDTEYMCIYAQSNMFCLC